jgi:NAD(P)H-dependent FMN reductase
MSLALNIVVGSTRPGRAGPKLGVWLHEQAREHGRFDARLVDLATFGLPLLDEAKHPRLQAYENAPTRRWSASVAAADAFVFVTPEYDFFPPASLVNAVQVLLKEWAYKPAGILSYGGISGGLRSSQALRQLLGNVNVHAIPQSVPVPMFSQHVGPDGVFRPTQPVVDGARLMLDELHKWAGALSGLRAQEAARAAA